MGNFVIQRSSSNKPIKPAPKRTTTAKSPCKDIGDLYTKLFQKPRIKKVIDIDSRVWKKIIASVPGSYQIPDTEALNKLLAASRHQELDS
ncbi:hypothetical protein ACLBWT_15585 [Paenibacillus sp. D51F]